MNKARMLASGLPDAREDLELLVEELSADPKADQELLAESRRSLARAQFYTTWLMRLEGLLAENEKDAAKKEQHQADLEAAVRLARIEIEDLQGLPLPSE